MVFKNLTGCQRGFSYIQILFASSVIAGLALLGLKMMKNQERLAKLTSQKFEISYLVNEMSHLLKDPQNCKASFEGLLASKSVRKINSLKKELKGGKYKEAIFYLKYFTFDSSKKLYGQGDIKILKYKLSDQSKSVSVRKGSTHLVVSFLSDDEKSKEISRFIPLKVNLNGERIKDCEVFENIKVGSVKESSNPSIHFRNGLHLGSKEVNSQLSVDGGLTLIPTTGELGVCSAENVGALIFSKKYDELFFCSTNGIWGTIGKLPSYFSKPLNYKVSVQDKSLVSLMTKRHRVCVINQIKSNESGSCKIIKLEPRGITNWKIIGQFSSPRGGQFCSAECYN